MRVRVLVILNGIVIKSVSSGVKLSGPNPSSNTDPGKVDDLHRIFGKTFNLSEP